MAHMHKCCCVFCKGLHSATKTLRWQAWPVPICTADLYRRLRRRGLVFFCGGVELRFVCLEMYVTCSMAARRRLLGRMAVAKAASTQGCVKLPGVESEAERDALRAAFDGVVKKRFDSVQTPYFSFLQFPLGLSKLEDTEKFLDSGECEINVPVVGQDGEKATTSVTYEQEQRMF